MESNHFVELTGIPGVSPDVERMFGAVDTDRSGKITPSELQKALQNGKGQNFSDRCCQLLVCKYQRIAYQIRKKSSKTNFLFPENFSDV